MISRNNPNHKTGRRIKRKWTPPPKSKKERIGLPTGLLDKYGNQILVGSKIRMYHYEGVVLYNRYSKDYGLCYGLWYGDKNPFDFDCYGKFIPISSDNGMRMEIVVYI